MANKRARLPFKKKFNYNILQPTHAGKIYCYFLIKAPIIKSKNKNKKNKNIKKTIR